LQAYVVRRLLQAVPLLLLISFLSFSLFLLIPGDPILATVQPGERLTEQDYQARRHQLGLDKPIPVHYAIWLSHAVQGDFGDSTHTRRPVMDDIKQRVPVTLQVGAIALFFSLLISIPAGVASAVWRNSAIDRVVTLGSVAGVAIPDFWFGIMLILLFSQRLHWLDPVGFAYIWKDPVTAIRLSIMPTLVLSQGLAAVIARQTRSSMLEVLSQDYVRTARAKGLTELRVVWLHALRNALLPIVTILGLVLGRIFAGAVIVETIFAIPGMGRLLVNSISFRDFQTVQAIVFIISVSVVTANLVTDLLYTRLDPRIRYS
jgi:peptide/nickel transport system permease protein